MLVIVAEVGCTMVKVPVTTATVLTAQVPEIAAGETVIAPKAKDGAGAFQVPATAGGVRVKTPSVRVTA